MDVSDLMHLRVERVRVLYIPVLEQREAEATIHRCHFSTLSCEGQARQLKSTKLQSVACAEQRACLILVGSSASMQRYLDNFVSALRR
jgi:hypothetical protein